MLPFDDTFALAADRRSLLKALAAIGFVAPAAAAARSRVAGAAPAPGAAPIAFARYQADATTLVVGLDGAPSDRDPHSQYDYRSTCVIRAVYEGLIGLKGSSTEEFEPLIAESWESNEDQSVWTFKIRPNVTFQNGDPCDANAVKASYERMLALNKGAVGVFKRFVSDPAQMSVPDAGTIVFDLKTPQPLFPTALAATYGPQVVNVNVAMANEADGDLGNAWMQLNSDGAGTGPYVVTEYDPATGVVLEKNPTYWGGWEGQHLDRIIIRVVEEAGTMRQLVEAGEVDIMDRFSVQLEDIEELQANANLVVDPQDSTEVEYLTMTEGGPLASVEARQAMCYAFPYEDVLAGIYKGLASQTPTLVAPMVRGYADGIPVFTTDLAKAKELLAAAGIAEGTELTVAMGAGADSASAELFQANLAEIGITLTIEKLDQSTFVGLFYGDTPAEERPAFMRWSWWPDYNDAWNVLQPTTSCDAWGSLGSNGGFYCNEEFDKLVAEAKDASTLEVYADVLKKAQEIIGVQDPPVISVAQPKWTTVLNKAVQGFAFNAINLGTYDFHKMHKTA
ncbi:MAG: ABC transporter substrate-binding protein [Chloroflexota bacterium]